MMRQYILMQQFTPCWMLADIKINLAKLTTVTRDFCTNRCKLAKIWQNSKIWFSQFPVKFADGDRVNHSAHPALTDH